MINWISVKDAMPGEHIDYVLVWTSTDDPAIAWYSRLASKWFQADCTVTELDHTVTHWRYITPPGTEDVQTLVEE